MTMRVPDGKLSAFWRETMSRTWAWVWTRDVRGQPAIAATCPQSRRPAGVLQHVADR